MPIAITRRAMLASTAGALVAVGLVASARADTMTLIAPFPAGGAVDLVARLIAEKLGPKLGGTMVVENRGGAGGMIGTSAVAKAEPDGRTLGLVSTSQLIANRYLYASMPYDPDADLTLISRVVTGTVVCAVNAKTAQARGWTTFRDLIAWSKANPDQVRMGSSGQGQVSHLMIETVKARTGASILHVPYKGGGPAIVDMLGGTIDMMFDVTPSVLQQVRTGAFRALAVGSRDRLAALPDVASMKEFADLGLGDVDFQTWYALVGPKDMESDVTERMRSALADVMADPQVTAKLAPTGFTAAVDAAGALGARIADEAPMWKEIVRVSGAKLE